MSLIIAATVQPRHNHRSGRSFLEKSRERQGCFEKRKVLPLHSCVWVARLHLLRFHVIRCRHSYDMSLLKLISVVNGACYLRSRYLHTNNLLPTCYTQLSTLLNSERQ
jgi:hypothetical protein